MRSILKKIHLWLSIPTGIIISITCLSGAILVFQQEILELANPSHYFVKDLKGETIPMDILIPMVNEQLENNQVTNVTIYDDPKRTYSMTLSEGFRISAFVDPYTGEVTGMYHFLENPFYTVMRIHRWLMDSTRTWGKTIVGITTLLFVFILITGLIVWLTPNGRAKKLLKINFKKGNRRLMYDLHNVLGTYTCIILLLCSLTGLMWSFDWYRNGVYKLIGIEMEEGGSERRRGGGRKKEELNIAHWETVLNKVKKENPKYGHIRMQDGNALVHQKSSVVSRSTDKYIFDKRTGEITQIELYKDQEKSAKVWGWVYSLHVGNYWGIWSKTLTFLASLVGVSLPITGYYLFFKRKKKIKDLKN